MTIKQQGGVFGRNPTFNDVTIEGDLEIDGTLKFDGDIDINSDLKVNGDLEVLGQSALGATIPSDAHATWSQYFVGEKGSVISEKLNAGGLFGMWLTDNVYIDNDTGNVAYLTTDEASAVRCEAGEIRFSSAPSGTAGAAMTLTQYAKFTTAGNLAFISGNGIDFSATSGTGTSELFDDYEEGTWTAQYTNTTPPTTPYTMDIVSADYVKIGNTVFITANIRTDSVNTSGALGALRISGLPFTCGSSVGIVSVSGASAWGGDFPSSGYVNPSSTQIILMYRSSANGATLESNAADLTSGATANQNTLQFSAIYTV